MIEDKDKLRWKKDNRVQHGRPTDLQPEEIWVRCYNVCFIGLKLEHQQHPDTVPKAVIHRKIKWTSETTVTWRGILSAPIEVTKTPHRPLEVVQHRGMQPSRAKYTGGIDKEQVTVDRRSLTGSNNNLYLAWMWPCNYFSTSDGFYWTSALQDDLREDRLGATPPFFALCRSWEIVKRLTITRLHTSILTISTSSLFLPSHWVV